MTVHAAGVFVKDAITLWLALVCQPPASVFASMLTIQFLVVSMALEAVKGLTVSVVVPAAAVAMAVTHRKKFM